MVDSRKINKFQTDAEFMAKELVEIKEWNKMILKKYSSAIQKNVELMGNYSILINETLNTLESAKIEIDRYINKDQIRGRYTQLENMIKKLEKIKREEYI